MRAAFSSDELTLLRQKNQSSRLYVGVHRPASIWSGRVNGAVTYPLAAITFDGGSPTSGNIIFDGMTLWIGSAAGLRDKGILRIRGDQTAAASGDLDVAEIGQYARDIEDDDYLTIVEDFRPVARVPRYNSDEWFMDYDISYTDQNENFGPLAKCGPSSFGFLEDSGAGDECIIQYVGERSAAYSPSASISSYAWTFPSAGSPSPATSTSQGTTASPISVTYDVAMPDGRYHYFTVTESTGKTHRRAQLNFIFERTGANAPYDAFLIDSVNGGPEQGGYRTRVRILNTDADTDDFPVGAHVCLFEEARFGDYWYITEVSGTINVADTVTGGASGATGTVTAISATLIAIRPTSGQFHGGEVITDDDTAATCRLRITNVGGNYPYRRYNVLEGWIVDGTVYTEPSTGEIEFEIETIDGVMRRLRSYPVALTNRSNLAKVVTWEDMYNLTLDMAALHACVWRSTLALVTDINLHRDIVTSSPAGATVIKYCDMEAGNLFDLIFNWYSRTMFGWLSSDMQSSLYFEIDRQIDDTVRASAGVPAAWTVQAGDRRARLEIGNPAHYDANAQITLYGVAYRTPQGGRSPDDPHDYEGEIEEWTEGIASPSQATLNLWAGNLRAKRNNDYPRANSPLSGNWRVDAVPQSYYVEYLTTSDTLRGFDLSGVKFIIRELDLQYDPNSSRLMATISGEGETQGLGGATITFPTPQDPPSDPPPAPIDPGVPDIPVDATEVWFLRTDTNRIPQGLVWSGDFFDTDEPSWNESAVPPSLVSGAGVHWMDCTPDGSEFVLASQDAGGQTIWAATDAYAASPGWSEILTIGASALGSTVSVISAPRYIGAKVSTLVQLTDGKRAYGEYHGSWVWDQVAITGDPRNAGLLPRAYMKIVTGTANFYSTADATLHTGWTSTIDFVHPWQNLIGGDRITFRRTTGPVNYVHNATGNNDPITGFNLPLTMTPVAIRIPIIRGALRGSALLFVDDDSGGNGDLYVGDGTTIAASGATTWKPGIAEYANLTGGDTIVWMVNTTTASQEIIRRSDDAGATFANRTGNFWTDIQTSGSFFANQLKLVYSRRGLIEQV